MAYDEDLGYRLRELLFMEQGLSVQPMFGGLAFLINGNMAVSASSRGGLLLRVDPAQTDQLLTRAQSATFRDERQGDAWLVADRPGRDSNQTRSATMGPSRRGLRAIAPAEAQQGREKVGVAEPDGDTLPLPISAVDEQLRGDRSEITSPPSTDTTHSIGGGNGRRD